MKLGKDEIQKIVLSSLLLGAVIYSYFTMLLGPLQKKQVQIRKLTVELQPQIATAQAQIKKTQGIAAAAPAAKATMESVVGMIPEGSPVAWFPPRIANLFKTAGVEKAATKLNNEFAEKELPGFRRLSWTVELPKIDFVQFAGAIAQIENAEPLLEISGLEMDASREDVEVQRANLTVNNLVKQ